MDSKEEKPDSKRSEFARQAEQPQPGIVAEFWDFLLHNKRWWITPIIVILLMLSVLVFLQGTAVAPFIYTLW